MIDIEIKAAPELDKAVAEAIGAKYVGDSMDGSQYGSTYEVDGVRISQPSTDLNAAFAAAEVVFADGFALHTAGKEVGGWKMFRCIVGVGWRDHGCESQFEEVGPSPALAICAAILELKKRYPRPSGNAEPS